jgi:ABC-type Mn2+/Zn2+ transport system permease subunit
MHLYTQILLWFFLFTSIMTIGINIGKERPKKQDLIISILVSISIAFGIYLG